MKKLLLVVFFTVFCITAGSAQSGQWKPLDKERAAAYGEVKTSLVNVTGSFFLFDTSSLTQALANAPERLSGGEGVIITIPDVNGKTEHYTMFESSNFAPELQAQYPEIRAYAGNSIENPSAILRLSLSPLGLSGMVLRDAGKTEFIERYTNADNVYIVFNSEGKRNRGRLPFTCLSVQDAQTDAIVPGATHRSSDFLFRTFRLALSCTGEYTAYFGGTVAGALAGMNQTMTRVNGVYEKDLAVKLVIISNNSSVIYTSAGSDPYGNAQSGGNPNWNTQLQNTLTNVIGNANYDIGHLFARTGGGGDAGCIGCVCSTGKGSGFTSPSNGQPEGDFFDIDYVAHEMGHQLGGNHTFSSRSENNTVNIEPGSGSTIMGYAGLEGSLNVQAHSDEYFAYRSIQQIQNNLATRFCSVNTSLTNPVMTIATGANVAIPRGTAFVLKAVNPQANPAGVTYCWEQDDDASTGALGSSSVVSATKTQGPTFRSLSPTTSPDRYMPALSTVLSNTLVSPSTWETVSNTSRVLNFTLTGRDNLSGGGQTKTASMSVSVTTIAGPFTVTSQNTNNISWAIGSTQTVTWNVANTNAAPISTANVNILLSTDGGLTYPTVLVANTANDGTQTVTAPNILAPYCRIMVQAVGNIYFSINSQSFSIGGTITNTCNTYTNNTPVAIPDGATNLTGIAVNVPTNVAITDVNTTLNVTHTALGNLAFLVQGPDGTQAVLWDGQCGSNDNMNITFDDSGTTVVCATPSTGTRRPVDALSAYNGKNSTGQWLLGFIDFVAGNTGTLNSWALEICSQQFLATDAFTGLQGFTIYPNPNTGNFTVDFTSSTSTDINVIVHDMRGRQVYDRRFANTGAFSGNIDLAGVQSGVYLVTVEDGGRKEVRKIVVQ